jgi:hypothetical protein
VNIWREVAGSELRDGYGFSSSRRTRWWVLTLSCGHRAERHVRYRKLDSPAPQGTRRTADDVLPPPGRVSCAVCTRYVVREIISSLDTSQVIR